MALRTFLHDQPTDFARRHPSLTAGTAPFRRIAQDRARLEADATGQAETRVIEIARHALGADQPAAIDRARNRAATVVAVFIALASNSATSATSSRNRIDTLRRRRLEFSPTNTVKRTPRNAGSNIVLCMTIGTGDKLHAPRIGPSKSALNETPISEAAHTHATSKHTQRTSKPVRLQPDQLRTRTQAMT